MPLDYATLDHLRLTHPAWRLLRSDHAALIASFLNRSFIIPNVRVMLQADLAEALEDELFGVRMRSGEGAFPKEAIEYLNDWASVEKGWLRKFYVQNSDEPHFDLMPATEKAIAWLDTLAARSFVGTESRLLTLFELLKQMRQGSDTNPETRIAQLQRRRDDIDAEIAQIAAGNMPMLDDTAVKDRFQQFTQIARELLTDFREVEHNFRGLDRRVRERIALWEGSKGALLGQIMGERDAIADSDQGRSFRAFWDFLMSSSRQEELSALLESVLRLPPVAALKPDARVLRVHYDWLEAGEHTQRTVAQLSQQLRRFLDDQAWLENRRIMDILRGIEAKAIALRVNPPSGEVMQIADTAAAIELPMERPLYNPTIKTKIAANALKSGDLGDTDANLDALYSQVVVDSVQLTQHIRTALRTRAQITLRELCEIQPLQHGLAEIVAYLQLAGETFKAVVDENNSEEIGWRRINAAGEPITKSAKVPRIIFMK